MNLLRHVAACVGEAGQSRQFHAPLTDDHDNHVHAALIASRAGTQWFTVRHLQWDHVVLNYTICGEEKLDHWRIGWVSHKPVTVGKYRGAPRIITILELQHTVVMLLFQ